MRITFDSSHHTQKKLNKITLYHMLLKQSQLKTTLSGMAWHSNITTYLKHDNKCFLSMSTSLNVTVREVLYGSGRIARLTRHRWGANSTV